MRVSSAARRYAIHVTTVERGERWGVCLELAAETGAIVNRANVADLVFETRAEAETAGWRLADEWISRLTGAGDSPDGRPLALEERALLVGCDHSIARCHACGLHHNFFELRAERFCARCHADLAPAIRRHLHDCDKILIRRVRDAGGAAAPEAAADATRTRARRPKPFARVCRLCDAPVIPGEPVSFRHGALVHLHCYQQQHARGA